MRNNKKYVRRKQLQFVLAVLGKPGREARTRSARGILIFSSNQKRQDIDARPYEKGLSNCIHFHELYRVFII